MTTVTSIFEELQTILSALVAVDESSIDDYLPPIETANTALVITPLEMSSVLSPEGHSGLRMMRSHRIRCEFWVKDAGVIADTLDTAREIAADAATLLRADPTLNGTVLGLIYMEGDTGDQTITAEVSDVLVQVGNHMFLPVAMMVPVYYVE